MDIDSLLNPQRKSALGLFDQAVTTYVDRSRVWYRLQQPVRWRKTTTGKCSSYIKPWLCKITRCYSRTNLSLHCVKLCERPKHVRRHDASDEATSGALVEVLPSPTVIPREESLGGLEVAKCLGSRLRGVT